MNPFRIAMVSLDSSHSVELTRLIQGDVADEMKVPGLVVKTCCRFPSRFQPEEGQNARQAQLEAWGVKAAASIEEAAKDVDGLIVSLNDPEDHWPIFQKVAPLGKPVFLDKPYADTVANGQKLHNLALQHKVPLWSSSSIPLLAPMVAARRVVPTPVLAHVYGPLGKAPAGSDVVWYGCHTFESLVAAMGPEAKSVRAMATDYGVTAQVSFPKGHGVVELNRNCYAYGGRLSDDKTTRVFGYNGEPETPTYLPLVQAIRDFFLYGKTPLPAVNAFAALLLAEAVEKSLAADGALTTV